ncbi:MAG: DapH/DapD/GlmU-related protein [Candidatus Pseudobacter hemicellulosilyticus]|uniref:DapH/DapD/GlmU-related protein n=1 Tax=Candidatus Pseudobacter hemicellulosilyticus TaxID=3121375 RepID=A0AAJ6BHS1_9BACT|nr:MAG: DapH/DapD/GlmU-related protein [Pseudobacter sp.]
MSNLHFVHESAVVDAGARVGEGTRIWHFCHIMAGSSIGKDCILGQNVFVGAGVVLGNGVKVQNNVSIYSGVECEDEVFLGPSVVFTNVINPRAAIERKEEFRPTLVKKGASIGANATVICGHTIGEYAMVGAAAVVTKDVPAFALVAGNPARQIGWVSVQGMKLDFDAAGYARCAGSGELYQQTAAGVCLLTGSK